MNFGIFLTVPSSGTIPEINISEVIMSTLLLGNGLNRSEKCSVSWIKLLEDLQTPEDAQFFENSLTFGYDLTAIKSQAAPEKADLKQIVAGKVESDFVQKLKDGSLKPEKTLHAGFLRLPFDTILTTNYDYILERIADPAFEPQRSTKETLYSRYRYQLAGNKPVYHIHGEAKYRKSICLGFEHYAGSLEKIRGDLVRTTGKNNFRLMDVLKNGEQPPEWYYRFFTDDVYMVGFGFDESELDLWWLLDYRRSESKIWNLVRNRIVYFDTDEQKNRESTQCRRRNALLEAFGVEVVVCDGITYKKRYEEALKKAEGMLSGKI